LDSNGVHWNIPEEWSVLKTFENKGDPIVLQAEDGGDCAPLKDLLGDQMADFEEGQLPQCVLSPPQVGNFCGYKYEMEDGTDGCQGRGYTMQSYDTISDLESDGAHLMHRGACGVCSSAEDIWAKMETLDNISPRLTFCAVNYLTSRDFQGMVDCVYDLGYSQPCSFMWTHYTIAGALLCASECLPDANNNVVGNLDPPECEYSDCIKCTTDSFDDEHYGFTGYSGLNGGVVDRSPSHNCSLYQPVMYDPCVGADPSKIASGSSISVAGNGAKPVDSGGTATKGSGFLLLFLWIFIMW
jgi:hypothetical protein